MPEAAGLPSTINPVLRCREALALIDWLCRAFGSERHAVYADGAGGIAHAQRRFGDGMVMRGSAREEDRGRRFAASADIGGRVTQSGCCILAGSDAHHARAAAAGAPIVDAPHSPTPAAAPAAAAIPKTLSGRSAATIPGPGAIESGEPPMRPH